MKKNHRFWLLALALSLLLTCAACGKKTVSYAPGNIPTAKQEQTADTRKNDTAETAPPRLTASRTRQRLRIRPRTIRSLTSRSRLMMPKRPRRTPKSRRIPKSRRKPSAWRSRSGWKKRRNSRNRSSLLRRTRTLRLHLTLRRRRPYRCTFPVPRCSIIWTSAPTA